MRARIERVLESYLPDRLDREDATQEILEAISASITRIYPRGADEGAALFQ